MFCVCLLPDANLGYPCQWPVRQGRQSWMSALSCFLPGAVWSSPLKQAADPESGKMRAGSEMVRSNFCDTLQKLWELSDRGVSAVRELS